MIEGDVICLYAFVWMQKISFFFQSYQEDSFKDDAEIWWNTHCFIKTTGTQLFDLNLNITFNQRTF